MKKIIFIGKTGSGKTTLCQRLHELRMEYKKTQTIEVYDHAIDTPGEYLENRHYYSALIVTAADADIIALIADCTAPESYFAPGFAGTFAKEVIGIVTKIGIAKSNQEIQQAEERLKMAGARQIFFVDTIEGIGLQELFEYFYSNVREVNP